MDRFREDITVRNVPVPAVNVEDADVENCLSLLTFLPMDEVRRLGALEGAEINHAKEVLAFEFVKIVHGEEEAKKALEAAKAPV